MPWSDADFRSTEVHLNHDIDSFYFQFIAIDTTPIIQYLANNKTNGVGISDRVELFFSEDKAMSTYYGLEIDSDLRILSFKSHYYRKVDLNWSWPKNILSLHANKNSMGFTVWGSIPRTFLKSMGLEKNNQILIGVFQADFTDVKNPNSVDWITWKSPNTPSPDFHTPAALQPYYFF